MSPRHFVSFIAGLLLAAFSGMSQTVSPDEAVAIAERSQGCVISINEAAILGTDGESARQAIGRRRFAGKIIAGGERFAIVDVQGAAIDFQDASTAPVFRAGKGAAAPFLFPNGEVIVQFKQPTDAVQAAAWAAEYAMEVVRRLDIKNSWLFKAATPLSSLESAAKGARSDKVLICEPNWWRQRVLRQADPLYPYQWHLKNTGEVPGTVAGNDMNVESVWTTHRGTPSQIICIVDDGLEIAHKDLVQNIIPGLSWDFVDNKADPTAGDHGTACGGVASARGFNDIGVRGVAPEAGLCGYRILGENVTADAVEAEAETRANDRVGTYSNSWGPSDDGQILEGPGPLTKVAMEEGIVKGRGGKGSIFVWAGGNGLDYGDNSNYDGYANWRYTIAVAASTSDGKQSYYSESGANLCVNAPSDGGEDLGITTVDRTGPIGYNVNGENQGNFADLDYTNDFGGTSSACPAVSGACALLLQGNPNLGWRDVKKILMTTAAKNDPTDCDWSANGAGLRVNHKYGFGRIDVAAAVSAAVNWTNLGPEVNAEGAATPNLPIPFGFQGASSTISISSAMTVESVEVYFTSDHKNWGDLQIVLTAPSGTRSVLAEKHNTSLSASSYNNWRFGSERHLGETALGDWTLTVNDLGSNGGGTFNSWRMVAYGAQPAGETVSMSLAASPIAGGSVSPDGSQVAADVAVGIAATASPGYSFVEWTASPESSVVFGGGGKLSLSATATLSGDATLTATFSQTAPVSAVVEFSVIPYGMGVSEPNTARIVNVGSGVVLFAAPASLISFVKWKAVPEGNAVFADSGKSGTTAKILGDVKITAIFGQSVRNLTQGSTVEVAAIDLGIETFKRMPKVYGVVSGKSYTLSVIGKFPSKKIVAEWQSKPMLYKSSDYRNPPEGLGARLVAQPVLGLPVENLIIDAKAEGVKADLTEWGPVVLPAPVIYAVYGVPSTGEELTLFGQYFGTKWPKITVETVNKGRYSYKTCTAIKRFPFKDARGKDSAMDPATGNSEVTIKYPRLTGTPTGYIILTSSMGMCSFIVPENVQ